jgi:hypothetical protein
MIAGKDVTWKHPSRNFRNLNPKVITLGENGEVLELFSNLLLINMPVFPTRFKAVILSIPNNFFYRKPSGWFKLQCPGTPVGIVSNTFLPGRAGTGISGIPPF